jgi:hypothetical protein
MSLVGLVKPRGQFLPTDLQAGTDLPAATQVALCEWWKMASACPAFRAVRRMGSP